MISGHFTWSCSLLKSFVRMWFSSALKGLIDSAPSEMLLWVSLLMFCVVSMPETLESMSKLREQSSKPPSPVPAVQRRRQAHRKARDKRVTVRLRAAKSRRVHPDHVLTRRPLFPSQGRKSQRLSKAAETTSKKASSKKTAPPEILKLKSQYGVDAWKRWIQWRQTQPNLEQPRFGCKSDRMMAVFTVTLHLHFKPLIVFFHPDVSSSSGAEGGHPSLHHRGAQLRPVLFHHWGEATKRRAVLPRQPLLPLPRHPAGKTRVSLFYWTLNQLLSAPS